jgi:hypothetical protein
VASDAQIAARNAVARKVVVRNGYPQPRDSPATGHLLDWPMRKRRPARVLVDSTRSIHVIVEHDNFSIFAITRNYLRHGEIARFDGSA